MRPTACSRRKATRSTTTGPGDHPASTIWYLPDQYIEVKDVPAGLCIFDTIADPDNTLTVADKSNNCGLVFVKLSNMGTSSPKAQLLGPGPLQGHCAVTP